MDVCYDVRIFVVHLWQSVMITVIFLEPYAMLQELCFFIQISPSHCVKKFSKENCKWEGRGQGADTDWCRRAQWWVSQIRVHCWRHICSGRSRLWSCCTRAARTRTEPGLTCSSARRRSDCRRRPPAVCRPTRPHAIIISLSSSWSVHYILNTWPFNS